MASCVFFNQFTQDLCNGVHNVITGTTHVLKVMLTNTTPNISSNQVLGDLTEIGTGHGYSAGGATVGTITGSQTGGTTTVIGGTDPQFTASGGTIGPFRYAVLYNSTPTSPLKPLICYWDYGSSLTLNSGENFTVNLDQVAGIFTLGT